MLDLGTLNYDQRGLIPVVAQDSATGEVLMLGYASRETLSESVDIGKLVFFSRSRNSRWLKGETSGNFLEIVSMITDCDRDSVIAKVRPHGPACHLGTQSCFGAES